jgi:putative endonuclease
MSHFVYILQCSDGTLYIGYTKNIKKRLYAHNNLKSGAKYTKTRRPVTIKYTETFSTLSEALKREVKLKKLSRQQKEELIKESLHKK